MSDDTTEPTETPELDPRQLAVAKALADLVRAAVTSAKRETMDEEHDARTAANTRWIEALELGMAPISRQLVEMMGNTEQLPEGLQTLLRLSANPEHQFDAIAKVCLWIMGLAGLAAASTQIGSQVWVNELWAQNPNKPLSPADAADAVVRNIMTPAQGEAAANQSGINGINFEHLVRLTGEPPGPVDMLSLWRRGLITQDFLEEAIRYSRIKDEYIQSIEWLAHSYMSPADVIELAVKGLKTPDEAQTMFGIAGGLEEQFELLFEGAGNAIGNEAALGLYNHGLIDKDRVYEVFGRSRMNPIFYDTAFLLRHKFLGVIQIMAMIKAGTVSTQDATEWLLADGYEANQVAAFVGAHANGGNASAKSETESIIVASYAQKLIDHAAAMAELAKIGYDPDAAGMILNLSDAKEAHKELTAAIDGVRSAYVADKITADVAGTDLDKLGVPAAAKTAWMQAWSVEKGTKVRTLTEAQVGGMAKKGIISYEVAVDRWEAMGYVRSDAWLLAENYGYTPPK